MTLVWSRLPCFRPRPLPSFSDYKRSRSPPTLPPPPPPPPFVPSPSVTPFTLNSLKRTLLLLSSASRLPAVISSVAYFFRLAHAPPPPSSPFSKGLEGVLHEARGTAMIIHPLTKQLRALFARHWFTRPVFFPVPCSNLIENTPWIIVEERGEEEGEVWKFYDFFRGEVEDWNLSPETVKRGGEGKGSFVWWIERDVACMDVELMIVGNSCGFNAGNEKFFVRDECYRCGRRVCDDLTKFI